MKYTKFGKEVYEYNGKTTRSRDFTASAAKAKGKIQKSKLDIERWGLAEAVSDRMMKGKR